MIASPTGSAPDRSLGCEGTERASSGYAGPMARLGILHETRYSYARPVGFGAHRLLIRPRDSHAIRISEASLQTSLPGETRWTYDAAGNCVCWFTPRGEADSLVITSR